MVVFNKKRAQSYDAWIQTPIGRYIDRREKDFIINLIAPKEGERLLDVGCGIGALAHDIAERAGCQVTGLDISADSIEAARARFSHPRLDFQLGDAMEDLPNGRFDVVVLSNVLEHIGRRTAFLGRLRERTAASRFLIRVPMFERDWRVPLKRELGVEWRLDPTHETEYTLEEFAGEMNGAGLRIVHQEIRWGEIWAEAVIDDDGE